MVDIERRVYSVGIPRVNVLIIRTFSVRIRTYEKRNSGNQP
jgi:hypothetical protein